MAKKKYKQCTLTRPEGSGIMKQVAWIPSGFASMGRIVKIKQDDGSWVGGWEIVGVGSNEIDEVPDINKMIRGHRKNTGDSLK